MDQKSYLQNILITILLIGIFCLGFYISYLGLKLSKVFDNNNPKEPPVYQAYNEATPQPINSVNPEKGIYNILFLGHGGTGHSGGGLTDSIIVAHIDTNTKKSTLITIPRDLWVPGNHKINYSAVQSGMNNMGGIIQNVTGLPINYYVAIDFGNFVKMIDSLGGIEVDVPTTFTDNFYPISGKENDTCGFTETEIFELKNKYSGYSLETQFKCRYETISYQKGIAKLDGTSGLKFVRSRHGDSDFGRSLRQTAVLEGVKNKLLSFESLGKLEGIIDSVSKIVKTDLSIGTIKTLVQTVTEKDKYEVNKIQLTTDNVLVASKSNDGQFILIPKSGNLNFSEIKSYIEKNL